MLKADVERHFGTQLAIAEALGISVQAVSQWGEIIPEGRAYKLESLTGGVLKVDPSLYRRPPSTAASAVA